MPDERENVTQEASELTCQETGEVQVEPALIFKVCGHGSEASTEANESLSGETFRTQGG